MIENVSELQELIEWCKANGVKSLKISDIEFELSDMALSEKYIDQSMPQGKPIKDQESNSLTTKTMIDTMDPEQAAQEDDEMLFWSSRT